MIPIKSIKARIFYKLLPKFIKYLNDRQRAYEAKFPKIEIEKKHIQNAKLISSRYEMLELMPKGMITGEIGVNKGDFSANILDKAKPLKLHLIDAWSSMNYPSELKREVEEKFRAEIAQGIIEINHGLSVNVLATFDDKYFDFLYIDTVHDYETTKEELRLSSSKVKDQGMIAGHDFSLGQWNQRVRFGVVEAVHEFCVEHDWEFIYLTHEVDRQLSFVLKKIL